MYFDSMASRLAVAGRGSIEEAGHVVLAMYFFC